MYIIIFIIISKMEDIFDITEGCGLNPKAQIYVPVKSNSDDSVYEFDKVPELNSTAKIFIPSLKEVSFPKRLIQMTYEIWRQLPDKMTLPPPGETFQSHLKQMMYDYYDDKNEEISQEVILYMTQRF